MRELELFRDRLHLNRRAMIQDSMERFTKEVVEMDTTANVSLNVIYQEAASLIQKTLDVDGALILDLSAFELVETVDEDGKTSFRFQADQYVNVSDNNGGRSSMDASHDDEGDLTPATESRPVNFLARQNSAHSIPTLPVLGTAESLPTPKDRSRPLTAPEHQKIAGWLKEFPNGKIYERVVPPWMRHMVPGGIQASVSQPSIVLSETYPLPLFPFSTPCVVRSTTSTTTRSHSVSQREAPPPYATANRLSSLVSALSLCLHLQRPEAVPRGFRAKVSSRDRSHHLERRS